MLHHYIWMYAFGVGPRWKEKLSRIARPLNEVFLLRKGCIQVELSCRVRGVYEKSIPLKLNKWFSSLDLFYLSTMSSSSLLSLLYSWYTELKDCQVLQQCKLTLISRTLRNRHCFCDDLFFLAKFCLPSNFCNL